MTDRKISTAGSGSANAVLALPGFIRKGLGGVMLDVAKLPMDGSFRAFVDRLFAQAAYFSGLDYDCFQKLLYQPESLRGDAKELRLAAEISVLSPARQSLYKEVRLVEQDAWAEYLFEPVFLEVSYQDPVYGEADATGQTPIIGYRDKVRTDPTQLDIDEFICVMWTKGVRFGIEVQTVRDAIAANRADRLVVARELAPQPGRDAELQEQFEGLRRDDSPLITAGKADLRRFKNRFPQIAQGQRMMKKIPRQLGEPGYRVTGETVDPELPKDVSLEAIAGPGTKIEKAADGQFIAAAASGFISIDLDSNKISVTEKIENKSGINARTTGDLALSVDEFVEHGEVQEGRIVEGKHMKFTSPVYGSLVSRAGRIELEDCLSGGRASSAGGSINIKKRALNASLEAVGGAIDVHYAENSTLIGDVVTIGQAVNCEVVANTLRIGVAQGCIIAAQSVEIGTSDLRRDKPTLVSVLVPDTTEALRTLTALQTAITEITRWVDALSDDMKKAAADPEFSKFSTLSEMVRTGKLSLSPAQESNFRQMQNRHVGTARAMDKLAKEKQEQQQLLLAKQAELTQFRRTQSAKTAGRQCTIREVVGETCVQQMQTNLGVADFKGVTGNDLGKILRERASPPQQIFLDAHGSLQWNYRATDQIGGLK
jgi:uncharacterized protein (DUF342 family)